MKILPLEFQKLSESFSAEVSFMFPGWVLRKFGLEMERVMQDWVHVALSALSSVCTLGRANLYERRRKPTYLPIQPLNFTSALGKC